MDDVTMQVKDMYERYPFPSSCIINVAYGKRIRNDLIGRGITPEALTILDAGCGSGEKVISLAKVFPDCQVVGWDLSSSSIRKAKELASREKVPNIRFEQVDLLNVDVKAYRDAFDVIVSWGVIHHLSDTVKGLKNLGLCLRPAGLIYVWVYALNSLGRIETQLFRDAIKLLLSKEGFSYEKGIQISHAIKGLLKTVNYSGRRDFLMRLQWFFDKDVDKKQIITHLIKNLGRVKYTTDHDENIVDSFLHANEKDYDVQMIYDETAQAGLEVVDFLDLPKRIEEVVQSELVRGLYEGLGPVERLKVMEKLTNPGHYLFLAKRTMQAA